MSPDPAPESWDQWTARVAAELGELRDGEWLTVTPATGTPTEVGQGPSRYAADERPRGRRWSLRRSPWSGVGARPRLVPDVFLQARRFAGVLAVECISDTQFEGLSDLSVDQEQALVALGWEQHRHDAAFQRTFPMGRTTEGADGGAGRRHGDDLTTTPGPPSGRGEFQHSPQVPPGRYGGNDHDPGTAPGVGAAGAAPGAAADAAAAEAAGLIRRTLEQVLGLPHPDQAVLRRS